jgi:aldehyde dehydrogenase (NAD+)
VQDEILSPIVTVSKFTFHNQIIYGSNDTTYRLAAGLHTKDYECTVRITDTLQKANTWVSQHNMVNSQHRLWRVKAEWH